MTARSKMSSRQPPGSRHRARTRPGLGVSNHVADLARSGRTIEAIKTHIHATGADLRTARDAVAAVNPIA
jgi:hypothetical protein